jgi:hypothetical protein
MWWELFFDRMFGLSMNQTHDVRLTASGIAALATATNLIVVLWVNWAMQARQALTIARKLVMRWNQEHPFANLRFAEIDPHPA